MATPALGRSAQLSRRQLVLVVIALAAGLSLAWVDTRPHFDDTGVLVMLLIGISIPIAAASGRWPWLWAVLIGAPVPIAELVGAGSPASLVALGCSALGAAAGWFLARGLRAGGR